MKDMINLAEKHGLYINWEKWDMGQVTMREIRNIITHEYPEEEEIIAEILNKLKILVEELGPLIYS